MRGRFSVFTHIYPEYRKIACMSWPFPVVGIAAIFTDAFRWCTCKAYVGKALVYKNQELVSFKQCTYPAIRLRSFIAIFFIDGGDNGIEPGSALTVAQTFY